LFVVVVISEEYINIFAVIVSGYYNYIQQVFSSNYSMNNVAELKIYRPLFTDDL